MSMKQAPTRDKMVVKVCCLYLAVEAYEMPGHVPAWWNGGT